MTPKHLPARTVDLSQKQKYLPSAAPQVGHPPKWALLRLIVQEAGFLIQVVLIFACSLSAAHAFNLWLQRNAFPDNEQRVVWSTVFVKNPGQPTPLQATPSPAGVSPQLNQAPTSLPHRTQKQPPQIAARNRPPTQTRSASRSQVAQRQQQKRQTQTRSLAPAVQPIQRTLQTDYGVQADKPYPYYKHWVTHTLSEYRSQHP